ncbi:MAG: hypothetical protein R2873_10250 [Caldilineaceae bacterium]
MTPPNSSGIWRSSTARSQVLAIQRMSRSAPRGSTSRSATLRRVTEVEVLVRVMV